MKETFTKITKIIDRYKKLGYTDFRCQTRIIYPADRIETHFVVITDFQKLNGKFWNKKSLWKEVAFKTDTEKEMKQMFNKINKYINEKTI